MMFEVCSSSCAHRLSSTLKQNTKAVLKTLKIEWLGEKGAKNY